VAIKMNDKALKRGFLMIAGILSVIVIVLSQSFYESSEIAHKKTTTEQEDNQSSTQTTISAPSDMVPHGNAVAINEDIPSAPEKIGSKDEPKKIVSVTKKVFSTLFKTLFRVFIAPNAP
jgi:ABC-type transport system involved in cytochrome bd biosynthesis fused ATPase/permease subunit